MYGPEETAPIDESKVVYVRILPPKGLPDYQKGYDDARAVYGKPTSISSSKNGAFNVVGCLFLGFVLAQLVDFVVNARKETKSDG